MARLIVQFPGVVNVVINGIVCGETNQVIRLGLGEHLVSLEGEATEPERHTVNVTTESDPEEVLHVVFVPAKAPVDRFSPLYCRYNGFLLGQFLSLIFASYGWDKYAERRARMTEFLREIAVEVALPEKPQELGGDAHVELLEDVIKKTHKESAELADFLVLGALLTHYGLLAGSDPLTSHESLDQCEHIRAKYDLPPLVPERFVKDGEKEGVDAVLSPSLEYLGEIVDQLEPENDTAFVIMPFKEPYASCFSTFYRPSLEQAGYRAFRAWGGLSNEDYCDLLLKLIEKSGMVWADVSELNYNVLYEVGAAHALEKLSLLVVREDYAGNIPANIGHDAVMQYSMTAEDWPDGTALLMTAIISTLKLAAERGKRLRVGPQGLQETLEFVVAVLRELLVPPEAREAAKRGNNKYSEGDYQAAERHYDEAIRLGLDDALTMLGRGTSRVLLGRYFEAESDLTQVLEDGKETQPREQRMLANFFRGMAREQQENYAGAVEDYDAAIEMGYPETEVRSRRVFANIKLGDLREACADVDRMSALDPQAPKTHEARGDLLAAEGRYPDAVSAYEKAIAAHPRANVQFARALALLMAGRVEEAVEGYRRGSQNADASDLHGALHDLETKGEGQPGLEECRAVLVSIVSEAD